MQYRKLGNTSLEISVIGIGTWQFGGEWGKSFTSAEVSDLLAAAKEEGMNFIDTAECYGDHLSEELIGQAVQKDRQDWVIATKFGHHFHGPMDRTDDYSPQTMLRQLDDSLRALRTDYIDLYQFHSGPDAAFDNDDLWTALDKEKQAGKIRHIGVSIAKNDQVYQTSQATQVGAEAIQVVYNRLDRKAEEKVFVSTQEQHLGVIARVPMASGYLSGKYKPGVNFDSDDVRHRHQREQTDEKLREAIRIQKEEVPEGVPLSRWALAWCLQHPAVTTVIPGCKTVQQVQDNARAAGLTDLVNDNHPQVIR